MTDALNDSTEQETKAVLASRAKQTSSEFICKWLETTKIFHYSIAPVEKKNGGMLVNLLERMCSPAPML